MKNFTEYLLEDADTYCFGKCKEFAHALQNHIGGEIKALHRHGKFYHAYVEKDGKTYDSHGERSTTRMALGLTGSTEGFSKETYDPSDHKLKPKVIDSANKYIQKNKYLFK